MKFDELLAVTARQPVFTTGLLLAGAVDPPDVRRQLSRWVRAGRVIQLRRGLYSLAAPYRSSPVHPFLVANALLPGSYVSLQSALAYYGLIPEYVVRTLSLTTLRPARWSNALGEFHFQHLAPHLYFGYAQSTALPGQEVFLASPEKALLDLVHLTPNGDDPAYLAGLRLQNLERLDLERLGSLADRAGKPKWLRAVTHISNLLENERSSYPGTQGASQTLPDTPL